MADDTHRLCGGMVHAVEAGYIETRRLFNTQTGEYSPYLYGFKGRKREQFLFINHCPWCGGRQWLADGIRQPLQCAEPLRMEMDGKTWEPVGFGREDSGAEGA